MKKQIILNEDEWKAIEDERTELAEFRTWYADANFNVAIQIKRVGLARISGLHCRKHDQWMLETAGGFWECGKCIMDSLDFSTAASKAPFVFPEIRLPKVCPEHGEMETGIMRRGKFEYICLNCEKTIGELKRNVESLLDEKEG